MAIIFQCPNCGANIADHEDQSVLTCNQCGTTVTKYIRQTSQVNVNIESNSVVHDVAAEKKQQRKKIEATTELIIVIATIAFFVFLFVGIGNLGK